jgi:hypothetical protein
MVAMTPKKRSRLAIRLLLLFVLILALAPLSSAEWNEKVLYSFQGGTDGAYPAGGVVFDAAGSLYGATYDGGANNCPGIAECGTVYQLSLPNQQGASWTETILYVFKGKNFNDGSTPGGGVLIDKAGNLYGSTSYGGSGSCVLLGTKTGCGTVFMLSPPKQKGGKWTETVLYSFKGGNDGYVPNGDLTVDNAGNLYGATLFGGGKGAGLCDPFYQGCGTVYKLTRPTHKGGKWTEKVLHSFAAGTDGYNPNGGLLLNSKGAIYGTTPIGGNQKCNFGNYQVGCGILFKLIPPMKMYEPWTEEIVHRFTDGTDGAGPNGELIFAAKGSIYGAAGSGGNGTGLGVVFQFSESPSGKWSETTLYSFQGKSDGRGPNPVTFDSSGSLYGTTSAGGAYFYGTFFRLKPPSEGGGWSFDLLYGDFNSSTGYPITGLVFDTLGNLYGATEFGGTGACQRGCGTAYELSPLGSSATVPHSSESEILP